MSCFGALRLFLLLYTHSCHSHTHTHTQFHIFLQELRNHTDTCTCAFHTYLNHTCDRVPPASMRVWPAACICVSMRVATYVCAYTVWKYVCLCVCVCVHVLQCNTVGGIVACVSYVLLSSRARCTEKARVLGGWEVTQAFFSIARTLLSIPPPSSVRPYKQMSQLELQERRITPSYIENAILVGNQMSCCLRAVWDMLAVWSIWKKNTVYLCSILLFILFLHSQGACSGAEAPL